MLTAPRRPDEPVLMKARWRETKKMFQSLRKPLTCSRKNVVYLQINGNSEYVLLYYSFAYSELLHRFYCGELA